jgi:hypothetical protein
MFIEAAWQESVIALLAAINVFLGSPNYTIPKVPLTMNSIETIAVSLQDGTYQPAQWFDRNEENQPAKKVASAIPSIEPNINYEVLLLSIEPSLPKMISKRGGGILFEDPFYALLASFNIGRFKKPWVEVLAFNREQVWLQRFAITEKLVQGTYQVEQFFSLAGMTLSMPNKQLVSPRNISGKSILRLDELHGMTEVPLNSDLGHLYLLYRYKTQ